MLVEACLFFSADLHSFFVKRRKVLWTPENFFPMNSITLLQGCFPPQKLQDQCKHTRSSST
jgi:hypothetical protein